MGFIKFKNKRLVNKIKTGDLVYLVNWIEDKKDKLYKIAWSYLYNHQDIEDIFQDCLIKVYENIDNLNKPDYFESWFISILINECRMKLRNRERIILKESIEYEEYHLDDYNFFQEINSIGEIYKEVIILKYVSGYSQAEIARILDIPLGTVKSRIYRGLEQLNDLIKEDRHGL